MQGEMLSTPEAMEYLGVGRTRLYKYISEGRLKVYKRKDNLKLSYFSKDELDQIKSGFNEFILAEELDPKSEPVTVQTAPARKPANRVVA